MKASPTRVFRDRRVLPKARFKYAFMPYVRFLVQTRFVSGSTGQPASFSFGGFSVWLDTPENWQQFLGIARPAKHLAMYVDREGQPLSDGWVATIAPGVSTQGQKWQQLVACLFYLSFARSLPFVQFRPNADNFYFEFFGVPDAAPVDSAEHVRYSKYGAGIWTDLRIYPGPDVTLQGNTIVLPDDKQARRLGLDSEAADLFIALDAEMLKADSGVLTAL